MKRLFVFLQRTAVAAVICKVGSAALSFIFIWSLAQILAPDDAGVFLYSYTLMMVLVQFSRAGTEHSMIKWLSGDIDQKTTLAIVGRTLIYVVVISIILVSSLLLVAKFGVLKVYGDETSYNVLMYFSGITIAFAIAQVFGSYFQSRAQIYLQYWCLGIGIALVGCLVSLVGVITETKISAQNYSHYFFLAVMAFVVSTLLAFFYVLRRNARLSLETVKNFEHDRTLRGLIKFTAPFSILAFIHITVQWSAQLISGVWLSDTDLAILSIAVRLATLVSFIFLAFNALLAPRISRLYDSGNTELIVKDSALLTSVGTIYAIALTLIYILFGKIILGAFGEVYVQGYLALLFLSVAWLIRVVMGPVGTILLMTGHVHVSKVNLYWSAFISIILAVVLIPVLEMLGAVLATALGGILLSTLNYWSLKRVSGIDYLSNASVRLQWNLFCNMLTRAKF